MSMSRVCQTAEPEKKIKRQRVRVKSCTSKTHCQESRQLRPGTAESRCPVADCGSWLNLRPCAGWQWKHRPIFRDLGFLSS